jgi:CheY-like chemotaxis protein
MHTSKGVSNPFRDLKVLVADADVFMSRIVEDILRTMGVASVWSTHSYADARMLVKRLQLDALVTDWLRDPNRVDGWCLIDEVRKAEDSLKPDLPVILCTAYTEYDRVLEGRDRGASEIVAKPVAPAQLMQKLYSAHYKRRLFIVSESYTGPDRRRLSRKWDALERRNNKILDQDAIDDLMRENAA